MAHTNSTANYELSQFLGTDKPAWLVDYNGDMLKIDTALKANADAEAESAEDIQELQDAIGAEGLTGRITEIENDIGDIKTEIGSVELPTTAQSLTGAIAELKGVNDDQTTAIGQNANNIAQVGGAVEGVSQLAYTIANVYDSSATYAIGAYAIYQNTLYKCTTAINVGETFDPAKWASVKVMSEIGSVAANNVSYDNTVSGLIATNAQGAIDEINTTVKNDRTQSTTAKIVGVDEDGAPIYEKVFKGNTLPNNTVLDASLTLSAVKHFTVVGCFTKDANSIESIPAATNVGGSNFHVTVNVKSTGLCASVEGFTVLTYRFVVRYSLNS